MKDYELLEKQATMMRMAEKYGVDDWWKLVKAHTIGDVYKTMANYSDYKLYPEGVYKFALGVVEGKPVFESDEMWHTGFGKVKIAAFECSIKGEGGLIVVKEHGHIYIADLSWNPPAPKTIMVELLVEDVEHVTDALGGRSVLAGGLGIRILTAFKKALKKRNEVIHLGIDGLE